MFDAAPTAHFADSLSNVWMIWKPLFDWGSEPVDDPAAYPRFDEVLRKFKELREQTHAFLDELGEEGLDWPTKCQPPGFSGFETAGAAIQIIAGHVIGHMGGVTVVRAAAGKQRLFVPSKELREFQRRLVMCTAPTAA